MSDGSVGAVPSRAPVICGVHGLVPEPGPRGVPRRGDRVLPPPRLLYEYASRHETGVLIVDDAESVRTILFHDGAVVWAESSEARHRFSEWLVAKGTVAEEAIAQAAGLVRSGVCRFGEALIRLGAVAPRDLGCAAARYVTALVVSTFEWRHGHYRFDPMRSNHDTVDPPVNVAEPLAVETIIVEAYLEMPYLGLVTLWLGDFGATRTLVADPFVVIGPAGLTEGRAALLRWLSLGSFTLAEAVAASPVGNEETIRLLGLLDAVGLIVPL